jgi:hypothetical protein
MGISSGDGPTSSVEGEPGLQRRPVSPSETPAYQLVAPGHRVGPVVGVLGWILVLVGFSVHGFPPEGASGEALVSWTKAMSSSRWAIGFDVELLGFLLELVFYAWLCDGLRRTKAAGWLVAVGFGAIVIWVGANFTATAFWTAMLSAGKQGLSAESLSALQDIAQETFYFTTAFHGVAMLAINWAAIQSRALPAWLSWAGLLIGAGIVIPNVTIAQGAEALVVLWTASLAGVFLIRPRQHRFT